MSAAEITRTILASVQAISARLRVRSAVNPMLWMSAVVGLPCLGMGVWARNDSWLLSGILVALGSAPIIVTLFAYVYLLFRDPAKLQSEDYQIRHEALQFIREKGNPVAINPTSLEAIANPAARNRSDGDGQ
jgi:hypothetical protein